MKRILFIMICCSLSATNAWAQTPQSINFQAIARNGNGTLMVNSSINARFTIHQGSASGTTVYQETHAVTTNDYALFSVKIGEGTVSSGSFAAIDWANNTYYLQVEIDAGSGYADMGSNQLVSVPYSLYSAEAGNVITYTGGSGISVSGSTISNTAPDQTVNLTGSGATSVSGTYPNFTISSTDNNTTYSVGSGLALTGTTFSNTAPDQTVSLSGSGATTVTGTYPNFTISSTDNINDADADPSNELQTITKSGSSITLSNGGGSVTDDNTTYSAGSGLALTGTTFSNIAPDQTVNLTGSGATSVSGTYPNFTISSTDNINDADADPSNELQTITKSGSSITLSNGGGSVTDDNTTYSAGSGLALTGTTFSNTGDINASDDITNTTTAAGDLSGTYPNPTVIALQGHSVSISSPANGQILKWDAAASQWTPAAETIDDNDWQVAGSTVFVDSSKTVETGSGSQPRVSMHAGRIAFLNTGYSVYIGEGAGAVDNIALGKNTGTGFKTLNHNNSGSSNTATGYNALFYNTSGSNNVATGYAALNNNTSGNNNAASGPYVMYNNTTGTGNAAFGDHTLFSNTSGHSNVAIGNNALYHNTSRNNLVAIGDSALFNNGTGATLFYHATANTAIGSKALFSNTTGFYNTANGFYALYHNTTGSANTGIGLDALYFNTTGNYNTANGVGSLYHNTTGSDNTATGIYALYSNTTGSANTGIGLNALSYNTSGHSNIAIGNDALYSNTSRSNLVAIGDSALFNNGAGATQSWQATENTAIGSKALFSNTIGYENTANGYQALFSNSLGYNNTAHGVRALYNNTTGTNNTANGVVALFSNTTGGYNTANGNDALYHNTSGYHNTASGAFALYSNTTGYYNTANGYDALYNDTTGSYNTANGYRALYHNTTGYRNTANGYQALYNNTTGYDNTAMGDHAFLYYNTYSNSTALGYSTYISASNQVRIGNSSVSSIGGYANWTNVSDARLKKDVRENVKGLGFIMKLRPVTYHLNMDAIARFTHTPDSLRLPESEQMKGSRLQSGFIAQEVEQSAHETGYDFSGVDAPENENDFYGLRYAEFVVPLVKAVQEQQSIINQQESTIEALNRKVDEMYQLLVKMKQNQ